MDEDAVRRRLAVAEFTLETAQTFSLIAPVLATLAYAVRLSTMNDQPVTNGQIGEMIGLDRHTVRRGLKALEGMGWIIERDGWVCAPRRARAAPSPRRWGERICILKRAGDRLDGRTPRAITNAPTTDAEYRAFSKAFIAMMKPAVGPAPTRFDDAYVLAACTISTLGRNPLGLGKISAACRIPRTSVGRRLQDLIARGWVERRGLAYAITPAFDASPERIARLAQRVEGIRTAIAELEAAERAGRESRHELCYKPDPC